MHRIRQRLIVERTALVNPMRALLLERGIAAPVGRVIFGKLIGEILEDSENGVSVRLRELLHRSRERWLRLDVDIKEMTRMITDVAGGSELCRRVSTVPGAGPIVSTAMVAAVGNAQMFRRGRDGCLARTRTATTLHGRQNELRRHQQTRQCIFSSSVHPRCPCSLQPHEARPIRTG
jgi:transposase